VLEEGPIRKRLGFIKRSFLSSPQTIEPWVKEAMQITGLDERETRRFLQDVGKFPFLYIIYDVHGTVIDWNSMPSEEAIRHWAARAFAKFPEAHSVKIFQGTINIVEKI